MLYSSDFPEVLGRIIVSYAIGNAQELGILSIINHRMFSWIKGNVCFLRIDGRRTLESWLQAAHALDQVQPQGVYLIKSNVPTHFVQRILAFAETVICAKCFSLESKLLTSEMSRVKIERLRCLYLGETELGGSVPSVLPSLEVLGLTNGKHDPSFILSISELKRTPRLKLLLMGGCYISDTWLNVIRTHLFSKNESITSNLQKKRNLTIEGTFLFSAVDFSNSPFLMNLTCSSSIKSASPNILQMMPSAATMAMDTRKQQPLHKAAQSNNSDLTIHLLKLGASVLSRDVHGATPAFRAAENGAIDTLCILLNLDEFRQSQLSLRNHRNESCLSIAATKGHTKALAVLLQAEETSSFSQILKIRADNDKFTALHAAVIGRHFSVLKFLLSFSKEEFDVDIVNRYGQTTLHLAARAGEYKFVNALLEAGANPNLKDDRGWTTLDVCLAFQTRTKANGVQCAKRLSLAGARHAGVPPRRKYHQRRLLSL